jgi:hypothetical protein
VRPAALAACPAPSSAAAPQASAGAQARDASPGSIRGRTEATYEPVPRQRDPNRVGDVETNRAQLNDDATLDERNPLDAMRLRVVDPNNITRP